VQAVYNTRLRTITLLRGTTGRTTTTLGLAGTTTTLGLAATTTLRAGARVRTTTLVCASVCNAAPRLMAINKMIFFMVVLTCCGKVVMKTPSCVPLKR